MISINRLLFIIACCILLIAISIKKLFYKKVTQNELLPNVSCRVDVTNITGSVQSGIFGTNLEWFNNGNGLIKKNRIDQDYIILAREQNITSLRYPGGTLADFYDWRNGIGDFKKRPFIGHVTDKGRSSNVFGTDEFLHFCSEVNAEPFITVNVGTGTAKQAADWVYYCNKKLSEKKVRYWELGNELYLSGSEVEKKISISAEEYCRKVIAYAQQMKQNDPEIKIIAIGTSSSLRVNIAKDTSWTRKVLKNTGSMIDLLSVHNGYFPVLKEPVPKNKKLVYESLWAAPEAVDRDLSRLDTLIEMTGLPDSFGIAVTEWGPFFSFNNPLWTDHVKTMGSGVFVARMLQVFLQHSRVKFAHYFKFNGLSFMGWIGYDKKPKVPYYVLQLYRNHFGSILVESSIETPYYSTRRVGFTGGEKNVQRLTSVASIDTVRNYLFVNIVNRSWDQKYAVNFQTDNFIITDSIAVIWMVSAISPLANNGSDLPEDLLNTLEEPQPSNQNISIKKKEFIINKPLSVPPHSVITVQIKGRIAKRI